MGESTNIQWCDHSWSPWRGCAKVSPGCLNCYAEALSKRNQAVLGEWGPQGKRIVNADWRKPESWNRAAKKNGERRRVFPSLCDPFERFVGTVVTAKGEPLTRSHFQECSPGMEDEPWGLDDLRFEFLNLIRRTPWLDWLVLTKRPENVRNGVREYVEAWGGDLAEVLPNLWLGVSVEDQQRADDRIPHLLQIPARVRFLSLEPLLGLVDLDEWLPQLSSDIPSPESQCPECGGVVACEADGYRCVHHDGIHLGCGWQGDEPDACAGIDWVIVGGESGTSARPCDIAWVRAIIKQCKAADVPVFVKQVGANVACPNDQVADWFGSCGHLSLTPTERYQGAIGRVIGFRDHKGGDPAEWPEDLVVREWPRTGGAA